MYNWCQETNDKNNTYEYSSNAIRFRGKKLNYKNDQKTTEIIKMDEKVLKY